MTDFSLIPILRSEGWKVMSRSKLKSMKKEELIETIETLENNYGATIERANNSYSYGKSEIERLEKGVEQLKAKIVYLEKTNSNAMQTIKEQDETIDAQDDKINFYVAKMNENILKKQELEEENEQLKADLEEAQKHCKAVDDVNAKLRCCGNCNNASYDCVERVIKGKCIKCNDLSEWELWELLK